MRPSAVCCHRSSLHPCKTCHGKTCHGMFWQHPFRSQCHSLDKIELVTRRAKSKVRRCNASKPREPIFWCGDVKSYSCPPALHSDSFANTLFMLSAYAFDASSRFVRFISLDCIAYINKSTHMSYIGKHGRYNMGVCRKEQMGRSGCKSASHFRHSDLPCTISSPSKALASKHNPLR
jgi:cation transport regulator ChaC